MPRYCAFDLEIAALLPEGVTDLDAHRPLGITCAALAWEYNGAILAATFCGHDDTGAIQPRMSQAECAALVHLLADLVAGGHTLLTHNGAGFDLRTLAEESGRWAECRTLAWQSVDTLYHLFCVNGYALGMDAIAKGMGLHGKTDGVRGADAPSLWAQGCRAEVLAYVAQDVRTTLQVAYAVEQSSCVRWVSKRGRPCTVPLARWLTVAEAHRLPLPDTSWMDAPWPRERFTGWLFENHARRAGEHGHAAQAGQGAGHPAATSQTDPAHDVPGRGAGVGCTPAG